MNRRRRSSGRRVPIIGLVGGIGSGKSTVARAFESLGCPVSDSDGATRAALAREDVKAQLVEWWGSSVLDRDGDVDRAAVARIVFRDPEERARLEGLLHPFARRARDELIEQAERDDSPGVIVDAPLLIEAGLDDECDAVVFIDAPRGDRLERVAVSRGWDEGELAGREKAQLPLEDKRRKSDYVLVNDAGEADLLPRVERLLAEIQADFRKAQGGE